MEGGCESHGTRQGGCFSVGGAPSSSARCRHAGWWLTTASLSCPPQMDGLAELLSEAELLETGRDALGDKWETTQAAMRTQMSAMEDDEAAAQGVLAGAYTRPLLTS